MLFESEEALIAELKERGRQVYSRWHLLHKRDQKKIPGLSRLFGKYARYIWFIPFFDSQNPEKRKKILNYLIYGCHGIYKSAVLNNPYLHKDPDSDRVLLGEESLFAIRECLKLMHHLHWGQTRRYVVPDPSIELGPPYILHCFKVASILARNLWPDLKAGRIKEEDFACLINAALLHDTVEEAVKKAKKKAEKEGKSFEEINKIIKRVERKTKKKIRSNLSQSMNREKAEMTLGIVMECTNRDYWKMKDKTEFYDTFKNKSLCACLLKLADMLAVGENIEEETIEQTEHALAQSNEYAEKVKSKGMPTQINDWIEQDKKYQDEKAKVETYAHDKLKNYHHLYDILIKVFASGKFGYIRGALSMLKEARGDKKRRIQPVIPDNICLVPEAWEHYCSPYLAEMRFGISEDPSSSKFPFSIPSKEESDSFAWNSVKERIAKRHQGRV